MTTGPDPTADPAVIARMTDDDFEKYWTALGIATRLSARHAAAVADDRDRAKQLLDAAAAAGKPINTTAATTQVRPNYDMDGRTPRPVAVGFRSAT